MPTIAELHKPYYERYSQAEKDDNFQEATKIVQEEINFWDGYKTKPISYVDRELVEAIERDLAILNRLFLGLIGVLKMKETIISLK